jgi:hypothetical protein
MPGLSSLNVTVPTDHAHLFFLATGLTDDTQKNNSHIPNKTTEHQM